MGLISWLLHKRKTADAEKRAELERDQKDAEREDKIKRIHGQIFKDADEAEKSTKVAKKLLEGNKTDIAEKIFLATREGNK